MNAVVKNMTEVVKEIFTIFFESDLKVISSDAERLLSDNENKQAYIDGLEKLRQQEKQGILNPKIKIKLKNNEELELTR